MVKKLDEIVNTAKNLTIRLERKTVAKWNKNDEIRDKKYFWLILLLHLLFYFILVSNKWYNFFRNRENV